jgi:DNA-binding MarR family transcriptional regulator/GNAT superfamily N-acetyltransferase
MTLSTSEAISVAELIDTQQQLVDSIRAFNRFYTQAIGTLSNGLLRTQYSLAEARVLYELARRELPTATALAKELDLDAGYLSRILRSFEVQDLITREASGEDARQSFINLTKKGRKEFARLNKASAQQITGLLEPLSPDGQRHLVTAMETIQDLLEAEKKEKSVQVPYMLRPHRPGDMGWVVQRQGLLYAREYGWDERFEALVARIVADFVDHYDSRRERCWIAERRGEPVGSVFLVKSNVNPEEVAQLRLLFVEASARGLGIGRHLVNECTLFARSAGYGKIILWTNKGLDVARHLYEEAGYQLKKEEPHHSFGKDLVGQFWELEV